MSEPAEISVIIANRNGKELLAGCLSSLRAAMSARKTDIIVVDNASDDGSVAMVREKFSEVRLLINRFNAGFAAANNQALKTASGRYLLLLNNDISFQGDLPGLLKDFLERHPAAGMVGPRLSRGDGRLQFSVYPRPGPLLSLLKLLRAYLILPIGLRARLFSGRHHDYSREGPVDRISGACVMVRAEAIKDAGLLDEDFFFYGEVHDWSWRMRKVGWETWYFPGAEAVHYGGRAAASQWDKARRHELMLEATFRLYGKHFARPRKIAIFFLEMLSSFSSWVLHAPFRGDKAALAGLEARRYAGALWAAISGRDKSRGPGHADPGSRGRDAAGKQR